MTLPWRGTLLYTGTLAAVAGTAAARFAGATDVQPPPAAEPAPTATATSATPDQGAADGSPLANGRDGSQDDPADGATAQGTPTPTAAATTTAPSPHPAAAPPVQAAPPAPAPVPAKPAPAPPAPVTSATVTGSTVQTPYGPVQVAVTFTNHVIASVQTLRHPSGNGTSNQINAHALPILAGEAVAANSASIAAVSGASYTSEGYRQSLQSAIDHRP